MHKCQGACEKHIGIVRLYNVKAEDGFDWSDYWYCDEAVSIDTENGFSVELIKENICNENNI